MRRLPALCLFVLCPLIALAFYPYNDIVIYWLDQTLISQLFILKLLPLNAISTKFIYSPIIVSKLILFIYLFFDSRLQSCKSINAPRMRYFWWCIWPVFMQLATGNEGSAGAQRNRRINMYCFLVQNLYINMLFEPNERSAFCCNLFLSFFFHCICSWIIKWKWLFFFNAHFLVLVTGSTAAWPALQIHS